MTAQHTPSTKLVSLNMSGNLHNVAVYCRKFGLSDFFVQAESDGNNSVVLFRLPVDWPVDEFGPAKASGSVA